MINLLIANPPLYPSLSGIIAQPAPSNLTFYCG
jgi:hypothetical protein